MINTFDTLGSEIIIETRRSSRPSATKDDKPMKPNNHGSAGYSKLPHEAKCLKLDSSHTSKYNTNIAD